MTAGTPIEKMYEFVRARIGDARRALGTNDIIAYGYIDNDGEFEGQFSTLESGKELLFKLFPSASGMRAALAAEPSVTHVPLVIWADNLVRTYFVALDGRKTDGVIN